MSQTDKHSTRRIVLPSGREVEVVHDLDYPSERDLHICPNCASELVQPSDWADGDAGRLALTLACPNCDWQESGFYERDQVEALEDELDDGLIAMIDDLHRLTQANMAADVDRFTEALRCDLVLPEDF
jgi:hypothetical protein